MPNTLTTKIDKAFLGRLCADAISNLDRACEKHPLFSDEMTSMSLGECQHILEEIKGINDTGETTAQLIGYEEHLEFNIELANGNRQKAYIELVDLMTVWLRVSLHLDDYLSAAHEPQANRVAVARPVGTPSLRIGHEVQPRLGCEKGVQP